MLNIDTTLNAYNKKNTTPQVFRKLCTEIKTKTITNSPTFTQMDRTKTQLPASQSQTDCIKLGPLPHYSSVFSAELLAIEEGLEILKNKRGKFFICSDSLSLPSTQ